MKPVRLTIPLDNAVLGRLKAGDEVLLSGTILVARDAAHKRIAEMLGRGDRRVPLPLKGAVIYYCGPTPARPGRAIGACGPTTSSRMDAFTPALLAQGVIGTIGKGKRSEAVKRAMKRHGAVYFLATGGIGALLATKVKRAAPVLFRELGCEAVYTFEVKDFPLIVGIDTQGRDIYR